MESCSLYDISMSCQLQVSFPLYLIKGDGLNNGMHTTARLRGCFVSPQKRHVLNALGCGGREGEEVEGRFHDSMKEER